MQQQTELSALDEILSTQTTSPMRENHSSTWQQIGQPAVVLQATGLHYTVLFVLLGKLSCYSFVNQLVNL